MKQGCGRRGLGGRRKLDPRLAKLDAARVFWRAAASRRSLSRRMSTSARIEAEATRRGALPGVVARQLAAQKALAVSRRSPGRARARRRPGARVRGSLLRQIGDACAKRLRALPSLRESAHRLVSACALARGRHAAVRSRRDRRAHDAEFARGRDRSLSRDCRRGGAGERRRLSGGGSRSASFRAHRRRSRGHSRAAAHEPSRLFALRQALFVSQARAR